MKKTNKPLSPDAPLFHTDHRRPKTRREFISQGFMMGSGAVIGASMLNMMAPQDAIAALANSSFIDKQLLHIHNGT